MGRNPKVYEYREVTVPRDVAMGEIHDFEEKGWALFAAAPAWTEPEPNGPDDDSDDDALPAIWLMFRKPARKVAQPTLDSQDFPGLEKRLVTVLKKAGFTNKSALATIPEARLVTVPGLGKHGLARVFEWLGKTFPDPTPPLPFPEPLAKLAEAVAAAPESED